MFRRTSSKPTISYAEKLANYHLLRSLAQDAVSFVEQTNRHTEEMTLRKLPSVDKKEAAIRRYVESIAHFGIQIMEPRILDMFIEAAVYDLQGTEMITTFEREPGDDT